MGLKPVVGDYRIGFFPDDCNLRTIIYVTRYEKRDRSGYYINLRYRPEKSQVQYFITFLFLLLPSIGKELQTAQEPENGHDPFAVAVLQEGIIVGHVPRDISRVWYFLERNNTITCRITDKRQRSSVSGKGLEVQGVFMFTGKPTHVDKLIRTFL